MPAKAWPRRSDDPVQAARLAAAAERTLAALPVAPSTEAARCRLLATLALELRGARDPRGPQAAAEAERLAENLGEPALLALALNGQFLHSCTRAGLAARRDRIGARIVELADRHDLPSSQVLGHLVRLQARGALGDFTGADHHAATADRLADRYERPLATVFTRWYRAMRLAAHGHPDAARQAYQAAEEELAAGGMPGLRGPGRSAFRARTPCGPDV
ncbi:hypothetical protein [Actinospica robiniae]|uniref:hypothetical protein n=1 Tax=Actinospica robiniae TaxID=304901 RepID=UPI0004054546|nr:hypothetical protein [Actinospica robiniae]